MSAVDQDVLRSNWEHQLAHQISNLPPIETFLDDLEDALAWWLQPELANPSLQLIPQATGQVVPRTFFPTIDLQTGPSVMDQIRHAAQNKLCALISYHGSMRLVEPYSLRYPSTGNELLHVEEIEKNGITSNTHKAYKTNEIESASISDKTFIPRWKIEL